MKRITAYSAVLAVFLLGVLIGAFGMHVLDARRTFGPPRGRGGPGGHEMFSQRLERALDLSDEQVAEIRIILEESRVEADALRTELAPRIHAQIDATTERIEQVLTPEQRERFRDMRDRHRRHAERFFLGGDHSPFKHRR